MRDDTLEHKYENAYEEGYREGVELSGSLYMWLHRMGREAEFEHALYDPLFRAECFEEFATELLDMAKICRKPKKWSTIVHDHPDKWVALTGVETVHGDIASAIFIDECSDDELKEMKRKYRPFN